MADIVERLRRLGVLDPLRLEAADEIERLIQRNAELLAVLTEIADLRYSNTSAASIAQSAIDTMKLLEHDP